MNEDANVHIANYSSYETHGGGLQSLRSVDSLKLPIRARQVPRLTSRSKWVGETEGHGQKKNGIMWEKFPSGGPPPPVWETPVIKKKSWVYFSF